MYRKVLVTGVTAAAILGAGGTALALTGSDAPTPGAGSSTSAAKHAGKHGDHKKGKQAKELRRLAHGQFVTKGKDGTFVTHDLINGTVTAVSPTSITVRAADKKSETFVVGKDTKVRQRTVAPKTSSGTKAKGAKGKASASSISKVAKGDHVVVAGTGTKSYAAKHIVDIKGTK